MKYAIVHLADIHYCKEESEGALKIFNALVDDLKNQKNIYSDYVYFLAITGDIVFEGADYDSYGSFERQFSHKLDKIGLTKNFRMIVPGNHDVDRKVIEQNFEKFQDQLKENISDEQKFNNLICRDKSLDSRFENYTLFESDFAEYGIGYNVAGKGWGLNQHLGVYCLNTSLSSFAGVSKKDDKNNLAIFTRGIVDWCNTTNTTINILLMHHPSSHLNSWGKEALKEIIENNFSLCLCGHNHEQDISYNKITNKSLICLAPQVFTNKSDLLGYAIILIEANSVSQIIYREYVKGSFLNGQRFSENSQGIICIQNNYLKSKDILEYKLKKALSFFKNQPEIFIRPKISREREFNSDQNLLDQIIENPEPSIIVSQPQFGLTCLAHYMRLEAFKLNHFWIYLDSKYIKARNIDSSIDLQLKEFDKTIEDVKCIIIDSWDSTILDHRNILKHIDKNYIGIPLIVMSNYFGFYFNFDFDFSKLNSDLKLLHLQAMQRNKVRELVAQYYKGKSIEKEDEIVTKVVMDLEALNVHRTPFNCLTLLKVFERDFNESLINRTKMIKAVLFILFTDADSFTYSSNKPDVSDCEYVLGRFCKNLIEKGQRDFTQVEFFDEVEQYCREKLINVDIETILEIFKSNNIILNVNGKLEFKHTHWIYYFAATYMLQDHSFMNYIFNDKNYVNFPEIIEFFTGIDGRRDEAIRVLLNDIRELNLTVENNIGIIGNFNPFERVIWNPSDSAIQSIKDSISDKVNSSKLPKSVKDQHADQCYNSEAPYDQSISKFLNDYSVISLIRNIKASSRALRNSNYINTDLKKEMRDAILNGWEQMSKVLFWLSPTLAQKGSAIYDGLYVVLFGEVEESCTKRLDAIIQSNPTNIVNYFKDDLSSKKIGPLLFDSLKNCKSELQKHFLSIFLIKERPTGWQSEVFEFMNQLHRNSFIIGKLYSLINYEIEKGFVTDNDLIELKKLLSIIVAKLEYSPENKVEEIPMDMTINEKNRLPIDKIIAVGKGKKVKHKIKARR